MAWLWNEATTTLISAPVTNSTTARMPIHVVNTMERPVHTVRRPGRWVNMVFMVPHPNSEPANSAPRTIAIAAPTGNAAPITALTNWSG